MELIHHIWGIYLLVQKTDECLFRGAFHGSVGWGGGKGHVCREKSLRRR